MEGEEIKELAKAGVFEQKPINGTIEETHISWVILSDEFAFKIKKPFKLSFLDYSTLSLRKKYCELELKLNSRFSEIYLGVLPISQQDGIWVLGKDGGKIKDYAVQMKRMDGQKRMDHLLENGKVKENEIKKLAKKVAQVHQNSPVIDTPFDLSKAKEIFNDIKSIDYYLFKKFGYEYSGLIGRAIDWSNDFLDKKQDRFRERVHEGYQRDLHGDLHSGNIFLEEEPIIFDCIEFEEKFRQIDLLYELAFLIMDLESFGEWKLASCFLSAYKHHFNPFNKEIDEDLFLYYKCLRANIRAKVQVLGAVQEQQAFATDKLWEKSKSYLDLIKKYLNEDLYGQGMLICK